MVECEKNLVPPLQTNKLHEKAYTSVSCNSHHQKLQYRQCYLWWKAHQNIIFFHKIYWLEKCHQNSVFITRYLIISDNDNNHIIIKLNYSETNDCIQLTFKDLQSIIKTVATFFLVTNCSTGGKNTDKPTNNLEQRYSQASLMYLYEKVLMPLISVTDCITFKCNNCNQTLPVLGYQSFRLIYSNFFI